jgi:ubiquinone/menaquinone biosynthesis C-methylase UbiE
MGAEVPPLTTWGAGAYSEIAERLVGVARLAVAAATVTAGDRVLDIACGTGNAALAAAVRGASVAGVDFEPQLLALASEAAERGGVKIEWLHGDVGALPVPDGAFDVVLSVFGVMYGPDQALAARELRRVCAPKARLALAAWTPGSFMPAMGGVLAPYLPAPPAGGSPPARWGSEDGLRALLEPTGIHIETLRHEHVELTFGNREQAVAFFIRTAGHVVAERSRLEGEQRWEDLRAALEHFVAERDEADGEQVRLRLEYLLATATAREGC